MAGLCFVVTGLNKAAALELMRKAIPILRNEFHAPVEKVSTVAVLENAFTVNGNGELSGVDPTTFYFPVFDSLQIPESKPQTVANRLAEVLGIPCHTLTAKVIAGFPPEIKK